MKTSLLKKIYFGLLIGKSLGVPVIFHPFPYNLAIYYPLQVYYGTVFKDFTEHLQPHDTNELYTKLKGNEHSSWHGDELTGGFKRLTQAVDNAEPKLAGPAHKSLQQLREDALSESSKTPN